jgi:S1-C subfamily serine protease
MDAEHIYKKTRPYLIDVKIYDEASKTWDTIGSAFIISYKSKQFIITAKHMFMEDTKYKLMLQDGKTLIVKDFTLSDKYDLALINITQSLAKGLKLSNKNPDIGTSVFHVGNPLGLVGCITEGIVSQYADGQLIASAPIAPGSSGGILLNNSDKVVGVAVAVNTQWSQFNFFVPVESMIDFLNTK